MEPIRRVSLHEEVLLRMREMIVEGHWQPGEVIPELAVSEDLQVSRTPIREALKVLAAEGLVEVSPRQGAVIRLMTPEEAYQVFEATGDIEAMAGRRACERATETELKAISKLQEQLEAAYQHHERRAYFEANQSIHKAIVEAGGNPVISGIHKALLARMRRIRYACTNEPENWQGAMSEHRLIFDQLQARNGEKLAAILIKHMQGGWERVRAFVEAEAASIHGRGSIRPVRSRRKRTGAKA